MATLILCKGDIIGVRSKGWLSNGIAIGSLTIGEKKTRLSHVGIITKGGTMREALITEALAHVVERPLASYVGTKMVVYEPLVSDVRRELLAAKATEYKGRTYGYLKIVAHFLDFCLNGAYIFRRLCLMDKYPICSWLVANCYKRIGISLGEDINEIQPDDIDDYCLKHPDVFLCKLNFEVLRG
jgi:hypothetical protein